MIYFRLGKKDKITSSDEAIINFINKNIEAIPTLKISDVMKTVATTSPCVIRLVKKLGFKGWKDFQNNVTTALLNKQNTTKLDVYQQAISQFKTLNTEKDIQKIAQKIIKANRVFLFGIGTSNDCARHGANLLNAAGQLAVHLKCCTTSPEILNIITKKDLLIIVSNSGQTLEALSIAQKLKDIPKISITKSQDNKLARLCKDNVFLPTHQLEYRSVARLSYAMTLIALDIIYEKIVELQSKIK